MDRIDFEELALKSMDPTLGPSIVHYGQPNVEVKEEEKRKAKVRLFPRSVSICLHSE